MPLRKLTDRYFVSPQITPEDIAEIRAEGITTVICNRPDDENPPNLQEAAIRDALETEGVAFVSLPFNQMTLSPEIVTAHREAVSNAPGNVLAYCASGNRSTVVWALGEADSGAQDADALVTAASAAGYDLTGLKPTLQTLAARAKG